MLVGAGCAGWSWLELVGAVCASWSCLCWLVVLAEVASSGVTLLHMAWGTYT